MDVMCFDSSTAVAVRSGQVAPSVCDPCKRRKKSCSKELPSCSRCVRLAVKCSYSVVETHSKEQHRLLPIIEVVPGLDAPLSRNPFPSQHSRLLYGAKYRFPRIDDQISLHASRLLSAISRKRGNLRGFIELYFSTFHGTLPIINRETFEWKLENATSDAHFSALLLSMFLVTHLAPQVGSPSSVVSSFAERELYPTIKSIHSLLQSTGNVSIELIQAGLLVACWEHCQALHQDGWLSIGVCVRMAHLMGLHTLLRKTLPKEKNERNMLETNRCLWWGVVVVERIINADYDGHKLPLASEAPNPDDFLPLDSLDNDSFFRVKDDLLLPDDVILGPTGWEAPKTRDLTIVGSFGLTVQAAFLASKVSRHMLDTERDLTARARDARKLDIALQSFIGSCIPPPGQSAGHYCGGFSMRTCFTFYLFQHEMKVASQFGNPEDLSRATFAMRSLIRTIIYVTKQGNSGCPIDLDTIAFWAHHMIYLAAEMHIKFGIRDEDWASDLEVMIDYLRYFSPRYKLYRNEVQKLELSRHDPPLMDEFRNPSIIQQ